MISLRQTIAGLVVFKVFFRAFSLFVGISIFSMVVTLKILSLIFYKFHLLFSNNIMDGCYSNHFFGRVKYQFIVSTEHPYSVQIKRKSFLKSIVYV